MSEYFKFLICMAVGLTVVTLFLRKVIDSMFTDWDPARYCASQVKQYLREKMEQHDDDPYRIRPAYKV